MSNDLRSWFVTFPNAFLIYITCNVNNLIITIITHDIAPREPSARRDNRSYSAGSGLRMYNTLVERCFTDCVDTFRRKTLDKQEETCVRRCAEKFLKHSMRVGLRFAELNQGAATPDE
ncbi:hypothetical protein E3N88_31947 [Mikania micrantha]|uniref:Mitochondrial import inner membrane translocase subunit n=1 Tax=Mikania micrantha TaxID=192012 RepID=A0A5N6M9R2_9ASTR|nr:hypothetical protein E3N88_31947 [Mikania micrantha]